ncbi:MAG: MASE1 domain-containing protein [Candidatus Sumerlaeaceae bacterium]|nr:MASE1 domain-containing protein [Candidatus Sumerlaeaceae bacterium]
MKVKKGIPSGQDVAGYLANVVLLAILYIVAWWLGQKVDFSREDTRVVWPQAGVALAGLCIFGTRCWPAIFAASLLVTQYIVKLPLFPARAQQEVPLALGFGFALANTLGAASGAWMLRYLGKIRFSLSRVHDVSVLVLYGALISPMINATVAVPFFVAQQPASQAIAEVLWWKRWVGTGISNLVVAPFVMTWLAAIISAVKPAKVKEWQLVPDQRPFTARWPLNRIGEAALLFSLLVVVCHAGFATEKLSREVFAFPITYTPFPLLVWGALRYGPRGAATTVFIVAVISTLGLSYKFGPFATVDMGLLLLQLYLTVLALTALFLSSAVTERRLAERELLTSREQLRALTGRLEQAREDERAAIAREIHDELGQQLTGLKMVLHSVVRRLPAQDPKINQKSEELTQLMDEAVQTVRRIATDLRPGILDDLGLVASMHWLVEQFEQRTGVPAEFRGPAEELAIDTDRKTALFRILQEALTNVTRHAHASTVSVTLLQKGRDLELTVTDDGRGGAANALAGTRSLGVVGMKERATLLGGEFDISEAQPGTRVMARIPVSAKEEA